MTLWKNLVVALVAAFALAACSSSNDNGGMTDAEEPGPQPMAVDTSGIHDDAMVEAFEATIQPGESTTRGDVTYSCPSGGDACMVEVMADRTATSTGGMATAANSGTFEEKLAAERGQEDAENQLTAIEAQEKAKRDAEAAAMASKLFVALDDDAEAFTVAVEAMQTYNKKATLPADGADVTRQIGTAEAVMVAFKAKDSGPLPKLGDWSGTEFTVTDGSDHVVVYTNVEAPKDMLFADWVGLTPDVTLANGAVTITGTNTGHVQGAVFQIASGDRPHKPNRDLDGNGTPDAFVTSGTFGGAPGVFTCPTTTACTSTALGNNMTNLAGGTWTFTPNAGAMAKVPDSDYQQFGWWLHQEVSGNYRVDTFFSGPPSTALSIAGLQGTATYTGKAAGKYAVYNAGTASGGAFTADAVLTADFSDQTAPGTLSGTVDNFQGGDDMGDWKVELKERTLTAEGGLAELTEDRATTLWTMNDIKPTQDDPSTSVWSAQLHSPVAAGAELAGTPLAVTGEFAATYGPTGRMAGAFGANRSGK